MTLTSKLMQKKMMLMNCWKYSTDNRDSFADILAIKGCTPLAEMKIEEISGSRPVRSKPYPTTASERKAIGEIVAEWKKLGIATETNSEYASSVLLLMKKTGENNLVIDYRRLNLQTKKQRFPLPKINDQLELLNGNKVFIVLDLSHGVLQIPL
jgi:hypothetical protein